MGALWCRAVGKSGGQGEGGRNHFTTHYIVKMDSKTATRTQVLGCGLVPVYGSPNAECLTAICIKVDATRHKGAPEFWDVVAEFDTQPISGHDPVDDQKQPDLRRAKWSARFIPIPMTRWHDLSGVLMADKAGTLFDPPPDIPIYVDQITVFRYESTCNRATHRTFMNAANSTTWNGAAAGTVLICSIDAQEEYIQGTYWFGITYEILYKPRFTLTMPKNTTATIGGWRPEYILNAGPKVLGADGKPIVPQGGYYDGRPILLDDSGKELARDANGAYTADPTYLSFNTKNQIAYSSLNLTPPSGWTVA
jgi:hypothetical protein